MQEYTNEMDDTFTLDSTMINEKDVSLEEDYQAWLEIISFGEETDFDA
jgi:hypothetical protein